MGTPVSSAECRGYRSHPELAAREKGRARRGGARLVPQPRALGAGHRGSDLPAGAAGRETRARGLGECRETVAYPLERAPAGSVTGVQLSPARGAAAPGRRPAGGAAAASPSSSPVEEGPEWGRPRVLGAGRARGSAAGAAAFRRGPFGRLCEGTEGLEHGALLRPAEGTAPLPDATAHTAPGSPAPPSPTGRHGAHLGVPQPGSPQPR